VDKIRLCPSNAFVLAMAILTPLHAQTPDPAQDRDMMKAEMMEQTARPRTLNSSNDSPK